MEIKLNNSLSKTTEIFTPLQANTVRMYSCGPTVYNYAHIGNMRAFLFADLLQRVMRVVGGYEVKWVMNITNIDDKTIRGSAAGSTDWKPEMGIQTNDPLENLLKYTAFYEKSFVDDIELLGIHREDFFAMPKATDFIVEMQDLITRIFNRGIAYISDGSIYFNVAEWRKIDVYGKLFKIDFDNFRAGVRIDSDQYDREQASDFVLWKAHREGEPYWDFELGGQNLKGRPGWHIECSAMEADLLGLPFDIHTGGIDLKFPHHEDEIAQSKAGYEIEPTVVWCHNEYLEVEGKKMSKSLGNFFTLRDLIDKGLDRFDLRYAMLSAHYASSYNFTFDGIKAARSARMKIQNYIHDLHNITNGEIEIDVNELKNSVFSELGSDLHTPKAISVIFTFINNTPAEKLSLGTRKELIALFTELNRIFDVWSIEARKDEHLNIPETVTSIAQQRFEARRNKNWAESDRLRNEIASLGWTIKDSKDSFTLEKI